MRRMQQHYRNGELVVVVDCSDLARSARFWSGVLGFKAGRVTGGPYRSLVPGNGEGIEVLLQQVPDGKQQKNRLHLDLRTADLDAEVRRVLGLGATLITDQAVIEDGWRWHVLADPDGNEFCVLQPPGSGQPST
jgi:predicted enzyme related to lactoylglutathione lyase